MHVIILRNSNKTDKTNHGINRTKTSKNSNSGFRPVERHISTFDRPTGRSKVKHELSTALKGSRICVSASRPVERCSTPFDRPTGRSKGTEPLSTALRGKSLVTKSYSTVERHRSAFDRATGRSTGAGHLSTAQQAGRQVLGAFRPHCYDSDCKVWDKQ